MNKPLGIKVIAWCNGLIGLIVLGSSINIFKAASNIQESVDKVTMLTGGWVVVLMGLVLAYSVVSFNSLKVRAWRETIFKGVFLGCLCLIGCWGYLWLMLPGGFFIWQTWYLSRPAVKEQFH